MSPLLRLPIARSSCALLIPYLSHLLTSNTNYFSACFTSRSRAIPILAHSSYAEGLTVGDRSQTVRTSHFTPFLPHLRLSGNVLAGLAFLGPVHFTRCFIVSSPEVTRNRDIRTSNKLRVRLRCGGSAGIKEGSRPRAFILRRSCSTSFRATSELRTYSLANFQIDF